MPDDPSGWEPALPTLYWRSQLFPLPMVVRPPLALLSVLPRPSAPLLKLHYPFVSRSGIDLPLRKLVSMPEVVLHVAALWQFRSLLDADVDLEIERPLVGMRAPSSQVEVMIALLPCPGKLWERDVSCSPVSP